MPTFRAAASLLAAMVLTGSLAACTGDDDPDEAAEPTPTPPPPVTVSVDVASVAGEGLRRPERKRISDDVRALVQEYVDAAFLGEYPRTTGFESALSTFTEGAAKEARRDLDLLTGAGLGEVEAVTAQELEVKLSLLAPRGRPAGGTAQVRFALDVDGSPVVYSGRLMLTRLSNEKRTWKIFGYELRRNDKRDALGASQQEGDS